MHVITVSKNSKLSIRIPEKFQTLKKTQPMFQGQLQLMIRIEENPTNLLRKILTQAIRQKLRNDIEPFVLVYCANGSVTPAHIAQILQLYTENFGNNMVTKLRYYILLWCFFYIYGMYILLGKKIKIQKDFNYDIDLQDFLLFK